MPSPRLLLATVSMACLLPLCATAQTATPPAPSDGAPASVVASPAAPAAAAAPAVTAAPSAPAAAATPAPAASAPVTHAELPALIEEVLVNNPEIVMKAAQKMREKQVTDSKKQASQSLDKHKDEIFKDTTSPSIGDEKTADITVVEFFDYHCGYCKQMMPSLQQLAKDDKKVRIIFREFPILSEDSVTASRAALAVNNIAKDKYFDFHIALMKTSGKFDEKAIMAAAKKVGVNTDKLKTEMAGANITAALDKNRELGEALGIRGTPALIVDDQLIPGAMPYEDLKKMIEQVRSGRKPESNG